MANLQTVLVADDSLTERTNLGRILKSAGYQVLSASSGDEAVRLAKAHLPDLILLDIIMDDGDGYKACRQLKREQSTAAIPVIMVSSKSNPVDKQWASKLGASDYLVKPYEERDLLDKLEAL